MVAFSADVSGGCGDQTLDSLTRVAQRQELSVQGSGAPHRAGCRPFLGLVCVVGAVVLAFRVPEKSEQYFRYALSVIGMLVFGVIGYTHGVSMAINAENMDDVILPRWVLIGT